MTQPLPPNLPFPTLRASLILAAVEGLGFALLAAALVLLGRADQVAPLAAALVACLAAAVIALDPVRRASRAGLQYVAMATLTASVLRMALAAAALSVLVWGLALPVVPSALWALVWYLVLLVVEVVVIYQYFGACAARAGASASSAHAPGTPA